MALGKASALVALLPLLCGTSPGAASKALCNEDALSCGGGPKKTEEENVLLQMQKTPLNSEWDKPYSHGGREHRRVQFRRRRRNRRQHRREHYAGKTTTSSSSSSTTTTTTTPTPSTTTTTTPTTTTPTTTTTTPTTTTTRAPCTSGNDEGGLLQRLRSPGLSPNPVTLTSRLKNDDCQCTGGNAVPGRAAGYMFAIIFLPDAGLLPGRFLTTSQSLSPALTGPRCS
eukprot:s735_g5.t1